jgi:beta-phosphoglucomutase family hydrolase
LPAALFDLNGTVVDDMKVHGQLWREVVLRLGKDVPASAFRREWAGVPTNEVLPQVIGRYLDPETVRRISDEKEARYREVYRDQVTEVPGAVAFLGRLRQAGVRLALATSAPRANRDLALDGLGLHQAFDHVVGIEDVRRGKPAPDLFLAAAERLGVAANECIVFEDALSGLEAAHAAGMRVAGIATAFTQDELRKAGATWAVDDFRSLPADLLGELGLVA